MMSGDSSGGSETIGLPDPDSGSICLDQDTIRYSLPDGGFVLPLHDVRIIGECTNENGPFADDYFFCFVTDETGWHEASFYASGRDEFLSALGAKLGASLELGLCGSTTFASRILWPAHLVGQPLFQYQPQEPTGFWSSLWLKLSPKCIQTLSPEALAALRTETDHDPNR